jgi:hypothetical protein
MDDLFDTRWCRSMEEALADLRAEYARPSAKDRPQLQRMIEGLEAELAHRTKRRTGVDAGVAPVGR